MNRDEILAKSRAENLGQDERDLHEDLRAGKASMAFGAALCFILVFIQMLFNEDLNIVSNTCYAIYSGMCCFHYSWLAIRLKKPVYWISVVVLGFIFVASTIFFILKLCQ